MGELEVAKILLQHDSDAAADSDDDNGWTPLYTVSRYGHLDVVVLLIQNGAACGLTSKRWLDSVVCSITTWPSGRRAFVDSRAAQVWILAKTKAGLSYARQHDMGFQASWNY